jgi:hypothetical protein
LATSREEEILALVKAKPYYSVRFLPASPMDLTLEQTVELVRSNEVMLRGWDVPHFDQNTIVRSQRYIGVQVNWERHVEMWRMYRTGQFIFFGAPWDLAMDMQQRLMQEFRHVMVPHESVRELVPGVLSFVGIVYSVTEFYIFAARLARALETQRIIFELGLKNIEGWALVTGEVGIPWHAFYQCRTPIIQLRLRDYDALVDDPVAAAASGLEEVFACFGWDNATNAITSWQTRLMAGRFAF